MQQVALGWSTCFGLGHLPASGTLGSLVAMVIYVVLIQFLPGFWHGLLWLLVAIASVPLASLAENSLDKIDPSEVISDEVVGMWLLLLLWQPSGLFSLLMAFACFRFFDIGKPWPVYCFEAYPGGLGIMLDDLLAAILSYALLSLLHVVI